ncbi:hypothetical protein M427DRAFT_151208 [Gonapodya prolifera JEL478]|uniref:Uncharacterized protein n=1 Tax=Gonapodya prolifera (strain JEL478) TaxID=1344416 RepID=A0A139AZS1_GONPJ|nr:hypothetical protein M427DRAFT_151208 [Gonapodya prolifera JEL478]|eukprot:KXS21975.1 hypothetical protein M427DRAFT_151208 [Gonapodya prolifera JEL478]
MRRGGPDEHDHEHEGSSTVLSPAGPPRAVSPPAAAPAPRPPSPIESVVINRPKGRSGVPPFYTRGRFYLHLVALVLAAAVAGVGYTTMTSLTPPTATLGAPLQSAAMSLTLYPVTVSGYFGLGAVGWTAVCVVVDILSTQWEWAWRRGYGEPPRWWMKGGVTVGFLAAGLALPVAVGGFVKHDSSLLASACLPSPPTPLTPALCTRLTALYALVVVMAASLGALAVYEIRWMRRTRTTGLLPGTGGIARVGSTRRPGYVQDDDDDGVPTIGRGKRQKDGDLIRVNGVLVRR